MTTTVEDAQAWRFIEPLDVLFLRGNQLFGESGSYGEALMPPWPSLAAGAIRSRMLVDDDIDLDAFARGEKHHPRLGTPSAPGSFRVLGFHLARRKAGSGQVEILHTLPADLVVSEAGNNAGSDTHTVARLHPMQTDTRLASSSPLALLPVLAQRERDKPTSGWWLSDEGWQKYLRGQTPACTDLVPGKALWQLEERIGIGLDQATRSASEGRLFTTSAIAMHRGAGFAVAVSGGAAPVDGLLRLGGDGRAARIESLKANCPQPDYEAIVAAGRCRMVLTSPAILAGGWRLPGLDAEQRIRLPGLSARLVAASANRAETISGWDLAARRPKAARRAVSSGAVYWLDDLQATADALRKLVGDGLWSDPCEDESRRAEGFNRFSFAAF